MKYRLPEMSDKDILQAYVEEHHNNGETSISASLGLSSSEYADWVRKIQNNALPGDEQWGKSLLYLCFDGDNLIGLLSIRYELSAVLSETVTPTPTTVPVDTVTPTTAPVDTTTPTPTTAPIDTVTPTARPTCTPTPTPAATVTSTATPAPATPTPRPAKNPAATSAPSGTPSANASDASASGSGGGDSSGKSGSGSTVPTGDDTHAAIWIIFMALAMTSMVMVTGRKKS